MLQGYSDKKNSTTLAYDNVSWIIVDKPACIMSKIDFKHTKKAPTFFVIFYPEETMTMPLVLLPLSRRADAPSSSMMETRPASLPGRRQSLRMVTLDILVHG